MKKIKISEQQANMLQELGKTKILKVTKEQYDKIIESERLVEGAGQSRVGHSFYTSFNGAAKNEFKNTKIKLEELYEKFINELYGVNESSELVYEKLHKLMEVAGLINNGRLVKEKFKGDKNIVKEIISMGLHEMYEGGSEYKVMEMIEQQLDLFKDLRPGETVEVDDESYKERLKKWLKNNKNHDNYRYFENQYKMGKYQNAINDITRLKEENKEGEVENPEGIVGLEILKYPPMSQLKKNRRDKGTEVRTINLPSIHSLDGYRTIHSQSEFTGYNTENSLGKVISFKGYIQKFKDTFKEEPIFEIKSNGTLDFDIINPIYVKAKHNDSHGIPVEQDVDEATVAGSANTGGSSGSDVVAPLLEPIRREGSNVVHELISDDVEIKVDNPLQKAVVGALEIINSDSVVPATIVDNKTKLKLSKLTKSVVNHDDTEDNVINKTLPSIKRKFPKMIENLIKYADNVHDDEVFDQYEEHIKGVYNILSYIKRMYEKIEKEKSGEAIEINEEGVQNSGQYDTPGFSNPDMTGDTPKGTGPTWKKPTIAGGKVVKVKEKCSEFPYCDQGPDAIEISK